MQFKNHYHVAESVFSEEFCDRIKYQATSGHYDYLDRSMGESSEIRKSTVVFMPRATNTAWLYTEVFEHLEATKKKNWRTFKLHELQDVQYAIYYDDGGHYSWHCDTAGHGSWGNMDKRVLSISILLSHPSDYEGGEFEIVEGVTNDIWKVMYSQEPDPSLVKTFKPPMGSAIVFPSITQHRVKPVTKGERISLVGWCNGTLV